MNFQRTVVLLLVLLWILPANAQVATDLYGGYVAAPSLKGATGAWRVEKRASKWLLVTPAGHYTWMMGVYDIASQNSGPSYASSYTTVILNKYGTKQTWGAMTNRRLLAWGFNTLGEYASSYVTGASVRMPYVVIAATSLYAVRPNSSGAQPVKDLMAGLDSSYTGYRGGTTPDVFDPSYTRFANWFLAQKLSAHTGDPYLIGISTDDSDALYGFGPGPDLPGLDGVIHVHLGWVALCTRPYQSSNSKLGVTYKDTTVYSKFAIHDMLVAKYGTIAALNAAWGSNYSTFGTNGGYGTGTGLLDEDGRHSWVGNYNQSSVPNPAVKADLDAFLYQFAQKYFSILHQAIRSVSTKVLIFGPATLDSHGGLTRPAILKAIGTNMDVLQVSLHNQQQLLNLTAKYAGDIPLSVHMIATSNKDSDLYSYSAKAFDVGTQANRENFYATSLTFNLGAVVTATGSQPIIGQKFWAWEDSWGEKRAYGLVSFLDNAYDGKQAVMAYSTDQFGYRRGGEKANYGNFLGGVTTVNKSVPNVIVNYVSTH